LQAIFQETRRTFVGGVPISQSASTLNSTNSLWSGVSADANIYDAASNPRNESGQQYQAFLTGRITDELSVRVAAHLLFGSHDAIQFTNTPAPVGGIAVAGNNNINPFTGLYTPNTVYGGAPTFTATASPVPDGIFNRSSFSSFFTEQQYDIQNDYVYEIKRDQFSGSLTGGYFLTRNTNEYRTNSYSLPAFSIYGPYVYTPYTDLGPSNQGFQKTSITQEYLVGNLTLLNKKLILSAGISNNRYLTYINSLTKKGTNSTNTTKVFKSAGVVVEPIETVSFYYGYSQSAAVNVPDVGVTTPPLQIGEQQEAGVRYKFLGGRGTATVDYFYVTQSNVQVPNPANLVFPAPVPPLPSLASDRVARGWEFSTNMEINKNLSAIANFTTFKNRDTFGAPFRGTAERSGALWAYFQSNPHSNDPGFGIGVGISYLSKRPGDAQNGYAPASVLAGTPVLKQPTFYLPAYYRVDLTASYRFSRHLSAQAMVENLFDTDYLAGSLNRNSVVAGVPINVKGSVNYSF
jgi:iron complex outermembrane receptor protein